MDTSNEGKSEDGRGGGVETDRENVAIAVVASELGHETGHHHAQVSECRDEGQGTG